MKTLLFLSHYDFNLYRLRLPIMRKLIEQNHHVIAVCPRGRVSPLFSQDQIHHIHWDCLRDNKNVVREAQTIWQLKQIINRYKPDLVHSFTLRPNLYSCYANFLNGFNTKLINTLTGLGTFYITNHTTKQKIILPILNLAYQTAFCLSDRVVFQNSDDRDYFVSKRLVSATRAHLIKSSGVNTGQFVPCEEKIPHKRALFQGKAPLVILFIGRIIQEKGIIEFYRAARQLKKVYGERVQCLAIGHVDKCNPSHIRDEVYNQMFESDTIQFLGRKEPIEPYYHAADVFCLPSYREGIPNTVLEAMSCGLPVVTTDSPGCRETIDDGVSGYLVPAREVQPLIDRLTALIENSERRRQMGMAGREKAIQEFAIDKIIEQYLALYNQLLEQ